MTRSPISLPARPLRTRSSRVVPPSGSTPLDCEHGPANIIWLGRNIYAHGDPYIHQGRMNWSRSSWHPLACEHSCVRRLSAVHYGAACIKCC
jgi:hypothetical protein